MGIYHKTRRVQLAGTMNYKHKHRQMTKSYFDRIAAVEDGLWSGNVDKWGAIQAFPEMSTAVTRKPR